MRAPTKKLIKNIKRLPEIFLEPILNPPLPGRRKYTGAYPIKNNDIIPRIRKIYSIGFLPNRVP
jgi:hypothetical protein